MISVQTSRVPLAPGGGAALAGPALSRTIRHWPARQSSRVDTHWTRVLYCDAFSANGSESRARGPSRVMLTVARRAAVAGAVCAGLYLAFIGLVFALQ